MQIMFAVRTRTRVVRAGSLDQAYRLHRRLARRGVPSRIVAY